MIPMFRGLAGAITLPMVGVTSLAVATGALAYAWYQGIPRFQRLIKPWFFPVISPD
ncbi:tail component of prophage CP-933X [Escherichia coli]|uniref:Tail component of prophage CP-933X n=1 Tax=Escherichia coli TaxID=562 RepID=A0A376ZH83_ECOLX|nr:tail component of prophage CP-933X [Escherichia coli]